MITNRVRQQNNRPTSTGQKLLSSVLAVGVFFGIGGLLAARSAQSTESVSLAASSSTSSQVSTTSVSQTTQATKKPTGTTAAVKTASATVVHATTKASKG